MTSQAIRPIAVMRTHLPCKRGTFSSGMGLWGFFCSSGKSVPMHLLHCNKSANRNNDLHSSWRYIEKHSKNNSPQIRMQRAPQDLSSSSVETILCRESCCQTRWKYYLRISSFWLRMLCAPLLLVKAYWYQLDGNNGLWWDVLERDIVSMSAGGAGPACGSSAVSWQLRMLNRFGFVRYMRLRRLFSFALLLL